VGKYKQRKDSERIENSFVCCLLPFAGTRISSQKEEKEKMFTKEELEYPGVFAQLGEVGYIEIRNLGDILSFDLDQEEVEVFKARFEGIDESGISIRKEYDDFDKLLEENQYFRDLEFVRRESRSKSQTSRSLQRVLKELEESDYGPFVQDVEIDYISCNKINKIKLKFAQEDWSNLSNKEGTLLPACCYSVSTIRDQFISALREDGWIDAEGMESIVSNMIAHDYGARHPAGIVKGIFEIIESCVKMRENGTENPLDPSDACSMIYHFASEFSWASMSSSFGDYDSRVCVINDIYNVIPAIHTLYHNIKKIGFDSVEGYALVNRPNGEVVKFNRGLAVFRTLDDAKEVSKEWIKRKQIKAKHLDIEFLDAVENPFVDPNRMLPELNQSDQQLAEKICNDIDDYSEQVVDENMLRILRVAKADIEKIKNRRNPAEIEF
jgi:hypothetical protein